VSRSLCELQEGSVGAFNVYAHPAHAFDEHAQQAAEHFAGYAAVAMINASLYSATAAR